MMPWLLRRMLSMSVTWLAITLVSFLLLSLAPGDFVSRLALNPSISPDLIENLRKQFGLDHPVLWQYLLWLKNVLQGHWGYSLMYRSSVGSLLLDHLGCTLLLGIVAFVATWLCVIPAAVYAVRYRGGLWDRLCSAVSLVSISMPVFFLAALALFIVAQHTQLPLGGVTRLDHFALPWWQQWVDVAVHVFVPACVLVAVQWGGAFRLTRSYVEEHSQALFVQALRSRGVSESRILWRHVLRHALNPLISTWGLQLSGLVSGAAFVEIVFSWPGLGQLMWEAVVNQDLFVVMGNMVLCAGVLLLGNMAADLGLMLNDPRIKVEAK